LKEKFHGIHLISNFNNCTCIDKYFKDKYYVKQWLEQIIKDSGLTILGDLFYSFGENVGFTGMIVLAESHVAIHTWPELKKVDCDVYVCNVTQDNSLKAEYIYLALKDLYQPENENFYKIKR